MNMSVYVGPANMMHVPILASGPRPSNPPPRLSPSSGSGRKGRVGHGVAIDKGLDVLVKDGAVVAVLVGDALLEGVVGEGLDEQVTEGVEDGADLGAGLPVLGLEQAEADGAGVVVGDVGVVDARDELDDGRLEGVVDGQRQHQPEPARVVDGAGRRRQRQVPRVDRRVGRQRDGEALGRLLRVFAVLLLCRPKDTR